MNNYPFRSLKLRPLDERLFLKKVKNMKTFSKFSIAAIILIFIVVTPIFRYCNKAKNVVLEQIEPNRMLKNYEYFKNLAAAIDKKYADISVYNSLISDADKSSKEDRDALRQRQNELLGIISMYNNLCAEYNAAMAKINYAFCNVGKMPDGLTAFDALPREFKPYITKL